MNTLSQNFIIQESDMEDNKLKQSSINNFEASFGKLLIDFVREGNTIRIMKFIGQENNVEFEEEMIVVDPDTNEEKTVLEKITKPCYSCTALIQILRKTVNDKSKCVLMESELAVSTPIDNSVIQPVNHPKETKEVVVDNE